MPRRKNATPPPQIDHPTVTEDVAGMGLLGMNANEGLGTVEPFPGTYGSIAINPISANLRDPNYPNVYPGMLPDGSELNPIYDPNIQFSDFSQRDLRKNDIDALQRLLQSRMGQIEMLKQYGMKNNSEEIRGELNQIQSEYERMATEIRQMILSYGDQPASGLDLPGHLQNWVHTWQAMTNDGIAAVDMILSTESDMLGAEEQTISTMHYSDCRELAMRQLGEERQLYRKLRELAQNLG